MGQVTVPGIHRALGLVLVGALGASVLWGLVARLIRRPPGKWYGRVVLAVAAALALQLVAGVVLVASGHHRPLLHYMYGGVTLFILMVGLTLARAIDRDRWVPLFWAALFALLTSLRALVTSR